MDQYVLVADDEPGVVKLASKVLERRGYKVLSASRGDEAFKLFKAHCADIVFAIVDFSMPAIDGAQLIELIHQSKPELKVLLTSGMEHSFFPSEVITNPMIHFLQKPFRLTDLINEVEELLSFQASSPKKNFNNLVVRSIS